MTDPIEALNTILKPLGSNLRHYMPVHRDAAIEAMRKVLEAEREQIASMVECDCCDVCGESPGYPKCANEIAALIRKGGEG